jgi:hypothetical protein
VIARRDAYVEQRKAAEISATFFVPTWVWL